MTDFPTQSNSDEFVVVAFVHAALWDFVIMVSILHVRMSVAVVEMFHFHSVLHVGSVEVVDGHARAGDPDRSHGKTARGFGNRWVNCHVEMEVLFACMIWIYSLGSVIG